MVIDPHQIPPEKLLEMIDVVRNRVKDHPVVLAMFKKYKVDPAEIDIVPMCFADIPVSARTDHGIIYFNFKLIEDGNFSDDDHYIVHELTHYLQQTTGTKPTKGSDDGNYLDNKEEIEGFQNQTEYLADTRDEDAAEEYVDQVLDHHDVEDNKERKRRKRQLLELASVAEVSLRVNAGGYRILYHISRRGPAIPRKRMNELDRDYDELWSKDYKPGKGPGGKKEYRGRKTVTENWGWNRKWLPEPVEGGVFLTDDPHAVMTYHGRMYRNGKVHVYKVAESIINEAGGLHRFSNATEILIPTDLWEKGVTDGRIIYRGAVSEHKKEQMEKYRDFPRIEHGQSLEPETAQRLKEMRSQISDMRLRGQLTFEQARWLDSVIENKKWVTKAPEEALQKWTATIMDLRNELQSGAIDNDTYSAVLSQLKISYMYNGEPPGPDDVAQGINAYREQQATLAKIRGNRGFGEAS